MTHKAELLAWFKRGLSITPAEAVDRFNNYRLADTVYQLRMDGHQIHTEIMERTNDEGRRVVWARYSYISGPGEAVFTDMPTQNDPAPAERKAGVLSKLWAKVRGGAK